MNSAQQEAYDRAQIMLAFARGEDVQIKMGDKWISTTPYWGQLLSANDYRIKSKPFEGWVWKFGTNSIGSQIFDSEQKCAHFFNGLNGRPVLMREVTDESR